MEKTFFWVKKANISKCCKCVELVVIDKRGSKFPRNIKRYAHKLALYSSKVLIRTIDKDLYFERDHETSQKEFHKQVLYRLDPKPIPDWIANKLNMDEEDKVQYVQPWLWYGGSASLNMPEGSIICDAKFEKNVKRYEFGTVSFAKALTN